MYQQQCQEPITSNHLYKADPHGAGGRQMVPDAEGHLLHLASRAGGFIRSGQDRGIPACNSISCNFDGE